ncbi:S66 peptidase family protein [Amycolatopsis taiwanensis]|uniref:Muramoyltetrapeptide carboxypeptidase n=1 Tax=Amycolatopsis taiwanensis TaxID=342230 RepID=A0A9W6VCZ1_9PSEU|nr:LD-carboxypeptidase [Amycolatopsis taiwanensis]GLY66698.1 muramoyltetrapeptide carboxypeptidase [Amycolatopsis taiwanensis]
MPRVRPGDTVALVAPAGPASPSALDKAAATLAGWGLTVKRFDSVRPVREYLADTDARRAELFQLAWTDPSVTAVIAARGGYGTQRMLDLLDFPALRAAGPKIFAGSSDLTAMHQAIAAHLGLPTLFSPMPAGTFFDDAAAEQLRRALFTPEAVLPGGDPLVPGTARGVLTGGNIALLAAGIGTPEHQPPRAAIAILEDIGEAPYRLDRMLTQLLRSGWFDGVRGIALGSFTACGDPADVRAVMLDRLAPLGVPILGGLSFGHCPAALTVPLGAEAVLDTRAGTLKTT